MREADETSADYIAFGPIFPTQSKERPDPVVGLAGLREARKLTRRPLVAIGGITLENAPAVIAAGADSVAVIRDLVQAPDVAQRAREFLRVCEGAGNAAVTSWTCQSHKSYELTAPLAPLGRGAGREGVQRIALADI